VGWAALSELVPYYPLYALFFLDTGLSESQVSFLFALWSVTALLTEVPAGALADRWSRRKVLAVAGALQAAAFAVWTVAPGFPSFAAGFIVWGVSGALVSGTSEALVYDGLAALGAQQSYVRINGWMTAAELGIQAPTALAASVLFALGGYGLVGWVSAGVCLAAGLLALRFPEAPRSREDDEAPLLTGVIESLRSPALRLVVPAVVLVGGLDAIEEYFPILAGDHGVPAAAVPGAVLGISLAGAAGAAGAAVGSRVRRFPVPITLAVAGLCLATAAVVPGWAALVPAAVFYGLYLAVLVVAEARLQDRITGPYRATITSVAGLGIEVASLLVFAAWAGGGPVAVAVLVLAVVPVTAAGLRSRAPA
jgi:MFS family permease